MRLSWLAFVVTLAPPMLAQKTSTIGGTGGTVFTQNCPAGYVLIGFGYYYGQWIDQMHGRCRKVDMASGATESAIEYTQTVGKTHPLNTSDHEECPSGYAIKSFSG